MYLSPSHTYSCKYTYTSKSTQEQRGNLAAHNARKPFGGRCSVPDPAGEAYSALPVKYDPITVCLLIALPQAP